MNVCAGRFATLIGASIALLAGSAPQVLAEDDLNEVESSAMAVARANKDRARIAPSFIEEPNYSRPETAKQAGEFGEVVLSGIIAADGKFHEPKIAVSSRSASIDAAALSSVPSMVFEPARDESGEALSIPANLPLEYSHVKFHGPEGLAQYRCDQFVRDYDWWYRTWPAEHQDRVFKTLRGYAVVADMRSGQSGTDFDTEWRSAIEACRKAPKKMMLDMLKPHGALFRGMVRK
jgi:TonB family protein